MFLKTKKKALNSPFRYYTEEEVAASELGNYYIQVGDSFFESESGKLAFDKERAEEFFMTAWQALKDMKEGGTQAEQDDANHCLLNFRIIPLKVH